MPYRARLFKGWTNAWYIASDDEESGDDGDNTGDDGNDTP